VLNLNKTMWFKIKLYFTFLLKSTNQHGVHSPFVYQLVTECFYNKKIISNIKFKKKIFSWIKKNKKIITTSNFHPKKAELLLKITHYFKPKNILEIDTSIGFETMALSIGNPISKITAFKKETTNIAITQNLFEDFKLESIQLITGDINKTLPFYLKNKQLDLVYFNKITSKENTLNYFNWCLEAVHNNSIFIINNLNNSKETQQTWETLKSHPKVSVSINTYFIGVLFFRKEQEQEHFTIRV